MTMLLTDVDPGITAGIVAAAMLIGWAAAWARGRSLRRQGRDASPAKLNDAILSLLGLLLAFNFSMALMKHEQRRQMSVADSNAIGDFTTCVGLLDDPIRGELLAMVRQYIQHRLALAQSPADLETLQVKLDEIRLMHDQMQSQVRSAVNQGAPVVVPLVMTLNEITSSHAARLASIRDRLPVSILLLLGFAAVLSMALIGWQQGVSADKHAVATIGFAALVCMVIWVTLDLNQPQRGWITISQEPLEQLLKGLDEQPAAASAGLSAQPTHQETKPDHKDVR